MIATKPDKRHRPNRIGPLARATAEKPLGELTAEGQRLLTEWLIQWPAPEALLHKAHRSLYNAAMLTIDLEDLRGLCFQGLSRAMISFDPAKAVFSTYAAHWIRQIVQEHIKKLNKADRYGLRVDSGHSRLAGGDDKVLFDLLPAHERDSIGEDDRRRYLREKVEAILVRRIPTWRHREIFRMKNGLGSHEKMTNREVGSIFGCSHGRIDQINRKVTAKIEDDLAILMEQLA